MKTLKDMLGEARQVIPEQPPAELKKRLDAGEPVVVVDVRDPDEYRDGSIDAATSLTDDTRPSADDVTDSAWSAVSLSEAVI